MAVRRISKNIKSVPNTTPNKFNKIISTLLIVALFLVLLWDITGPYGLWKLHHLKHERDNIFTSNIELDKRNQELKSIILMLQSNRQFQEKWIRKKLGWVKKDELLFVFISKNGE